LPSSWQSRTCFRVGFAATVSAILLPFQTIDAMRRASLGVSTRAAQPAMREAADFAVASSATSVDQDGRSARRRPAARGRRMFDRRINSSANG
jgi:hypothetical protein